VLLCSCYRGRALRAAAPADSARCVCAVATAADVKTRDALRAEFGHLSNDPVSYFSSICCVLSPGDYTAAIRQRLARLGVLAAPLEPLIAGFVAAAKHRPPFLTMAVTFQPIRCALDNEQLEAVMRAQAMVAHGPVVSSGVRGRMLKWVAPPCLRRLVDTDCDASAGDGGSSCVARTASVP
jgi:hypothetical protein